MSSRHPKDRPTQGVDAENRVLKILARHGITAERAGGHHPYDLVSGRLKIQVKAPRLTACPDARGNAVRAHVASNIRPGASHIIIAAMDANRRNIQKMYIMPSSAVTGRTLTITRTMAAKLKKWENRFDLLGGKK